MKILTAGCSFTTNHDPNEKSWPDHLCEYGHIIKNLGACAAGNEYIANSTILELITSSRTYDLVLVMWSGLLRRDFWVDSQAVSMYKQSTFPRKHFVGNVDAVFGSATVDTCHEVIRRIKKERDMIMSEEAKAILSILDIIKLQEFLTSKKIEWRFMTYANYWSEVKVQSGNVNINSYESTKILSESLDFSRFIFYNKQRDGLYEFAESRNQLQKDMFHPTGKATSAWADIIIDNLGI